MAKKHSYGNSSLQVAKVNRNDEFYTRLCDIEDEVGNYWQYLKGKTVYCPCMLKHNPEQFEILDFVARPAINNRNRFDRFIIRRRDRPANCS